MQGPSPPGCSRGMQRVVALVSSLTLVSHSGAAAPPGECPALLYHLLQVGVIVGVVGVLHAEVPGRARTGRPGWFAASRPPGLPSWACGTNDLPARPGMSRRARATVPFSTSLGPISMRSGTPRISQSLNLKPGVTSSRSSTLMRKLLSSALTPFHGFHHGGFFGIVFVDGHDHHLDGRQAGRQHQALVVAVGHDDGADEAGGQAPGGGPGVLQLVVLIQELDVEGLGEVLPQEVRGAGLQGAGIAHHGFDGVGAARPRQISRRSLLRPGTTGTAASLMAKSA